MTWRAPYLRRNRPRSAAAPLFWRWRPNPLRRRTDTVRAWLGLTVLLAVLAVAPVAAALVGDAAHRHYRDVARHQQQTRHLTDAILVHDAPRHPEPGSDEEKKTRYPVEVRVVTREGRTRTTRAEVHPGLTADSTVRIWIDTARRGDRRAADRQGGAQPRRGLGTARRDRRRSRGRRRARRQRSRAAPPQPRPLGRRVGGDGPRWTTPT